MGTKRKAIWNRSWLVIPFVWLCFVGCTGDRHPLRALSEPRDYQALELLLTRQGFYVDSLYLNYPDSYEFTDRVYSYPCGKSEGTLVLSFDTAGVTRIQILFCDRSRWLLPLPDTAKSSTGSFETFASVRDAVSNEENESPAPYYVSGKAWCRWKSGLSLTWDSASSVVSLTLPAAQHTASQPTEEEVIPWFVNPNSVQGFDPSRVFLRFPFDTIASAHLSTGGLLIDDFDTLYGLPGASQFVLSKEGSVQLRLFTTFMGMPTSLGDSVIASTVRHLGRPDRTGVDYSEWDLGTRYYRIQRPDSLMLQVAVIGKSDTSNEQSLEVLKTAELTKFEIPRSTIDSIVQRTDFRKGSNLTRIIADREIWLLWRRLHGQ